MSALGKCGFCGRDAVVVLTLPVKFGRTWKTCNRPGSLPVASVCSEHEALELAGLISQYPSAAVVRAVAR